MLNPREPFFTPFYDKALISAIIYESMQKIYSKTTFSNTIVWGLLIIFIVAAILTGVFTYRGVLSFVATGEIPGPGSPVIANKATPTLDALSTESVSNPTDLPPSVGPEPKPWDGASRVTVLIMGLDYRDWKRKQGASRTDTMILFTVNPLTKSAGILNIPRDLWVSIPGYGYGKINTAYFLGEVDKYPGGGSGLAIATVEKFLGVPITFYAQVDFRAFEIFIDEIGGVDITIPATIKIDPIGQNNTITLEPGTYHLDGDRTLAYARARNTQGGDLDRAVRQQQVIMAIRDRILNLNMLPTLMGKAPTLYNELASGIHTNMTPEQAISLAWLAQQIPAANIKRAVITVPDMVIPTTTPDGSQDILKPITSKIRELRDSLFGDFGVTSPLVANSDQQTLMKDENAKISILNGSGVSGMATRTSDYFKAQGANIIQVGDAGDLYNYTIITLYIGKPHTLRYFVDMMKIQANNIRFKYDPNSNIDVVIQLGADWAYKNPMP